MIDLLAESKSKRTSRPVPLFAYGTLREGESLDNSWLSDIRVDSEIGRAYGYELMVPSGGWFPYLVPSHKWSTVGELTWVLPGDKLSSLIAMEIGAGYSLEVIDVFVSSINIEVPAFAFVWNEAVPSSWRQVRNNDWAAREYEGVIF